MQRPICPRACVAEQVQVELKIGDEAPQADASWDFRPIESVTHCVTLSWQAKISERAFGVEFAAALSGLVPRRSAVAAIDSPTPAREFYA